MGVEVTNAFGLFEFLCYQVRSCKVLTLIHLSTSVIRCFIIASGVVLLFAFCHFEDYFQLFMLTKYVEFKNLDWICLQPCTFCNLILNRYTKISILLNPAIRVIFFVDSLFTIYKRLRFATRAYTLFCTRILYFAIT